MKFIISEFFYKAPTFFLDSDKCKSYKYADCKSKPGVSSLCQALCQCQGFKCVNNGELIVSNQKECKCICGDNYTGDNCEKEVCYDQAFCGTFGISYCNQPIVSENCPAMCGLCS